MRLSVLPSALMCLRTSATVASAMPRGAADQRGCVCVRERERDAVGLVCCSALPSPQGLQVRRHSL